MSLLKVYGVPLSQPFRAVVWALLQKQEPFQVQIAIPGSPSRVGTRHETFTALTGGRTDSIPVLEDDGEIIVESPAILTYLCAKHQWEDLYETSDLIRRTRIDAYLHWHHGNTRQLANISKHILRPHLQADTDATAERLQPVLERFGAWIKDGFIGGGAHPSIADICAYEEFCQNTMTGLLNEVPAPIQEWMAHMEDLPFHDEAHVALKTLGSLKDSSDMPQRLRAATTDGLKMIKEAQNSYTQS